MAGKNICTADSVMRFIIGIVFLFFAVAATPWVDLMQISGSQWYLQSILAVLIGIWFIRAGWTKCCPVNKALGVNTVKKSAR